MKMTQMVEEIRQIRAEVHDLRVELTRYKGFMGGVLWCVSATAACVGFVWGLVSGWQN